VTAFTHLTVFRTIKSGVLKRLASLTTSEEDREHEHLHPDHHEALANTDLLKHMDDPPPLCLKF
jgi:hypothetical protein